MQLNYCIIQATDMFQFQHGFLQVGCGLYSICIYYRKEETTSIVNIFHS